MTDWSRLDAYIAAPLAWGAGMVKNNAKAVGMAKGMVDSAISGATLPGDVVTGKVDPMSDEGFQRVQDLSGLMGGGAQFGSKPKGALGMFYNEHSPGFDRDRLRGAIELMAQDAPEKEIWAKTLTGQEPSGMWIQEGSDHLARLDMSKLPERRPLGAYYKQMKQDHPTASPLDRALGARAAFRLGAPDPVPLSSMLHHPDLYQKMPSARVIPVRQEVHPAHLGGFNADTGVLSVSREGNPLEVILHEIQHYTDNDAGFLQDGGNPAQFLHSPWREHMLPGETLEQAYLRLSGEQRADAVAKRASLTPQQRALRHFKEDMIPFDQQITRIR